MPPTPRPIVRAPTLPMADTRTVGTVPPCSARTAWRSLGNGHTQLTLSRAVEHAERRRPKAAHHRSGSEWPLLDSLENIGTKRRQLWVVLATRLKSRRNMPQRAHPNDTCLSSPCVSLGLIEDAGRNLDYSILIPIQPREKCDHNRDAAEACCDHRIDSLHLGRLSLNHRSLTIS
jgi:hypothetical protein